MLLADFPHIEEEDSGPCVGIEWTGHAVANTGGDAERTLARTPALRGIPGSPGESGLVSRGSQGLRSPLESRRGALGAP